MWTIFHQAKSTAQHAAETLDHAQRLASSIYAPGFHAARKAGQGTGFWQFRGYLPDDPRRDIDWRKTARADKTIIRQREDERAQSLGLWLDNNPGMSIPYHHARPTKRECAQILLLALGFVTIHEHDTVRTIAVQPKTARADKAMSEIMLGLGAPDAPAFEDLKSVPLKNSGIHILAGDFLNPLNEIDKIFSALPSTGKQFLILHCLDPDELSLPYKGRAVFWNSTQASSERIDHVPDIQSAYSEKIKTHLLGLEALCAEHGFLYLRHLCGENLTATLNAAIHILNHEARGS